MSNDNKGNKPAFSYNAGSVRGSIFINTTKENSWFSTKIVKSYNEGTKDRPDYKETTNYNTNDLADLQLVSSKCFEFTRQNYANDKKFD